MRRSKIMLGLAAATICAANLSSVAGADEPLSQYEQSLACKFSQTCDPATLAPYEAETDAEEQTVEVGPEAAWSVFKPSKPQGGKASGPAPATQSASQGGSSPKLYQPRGGQPQVARNNSAKVYNAPEPKRKARPAFVRPKAAEMTLEFSNASAEVNGKGQSEIAAWAKVLKSEKFADKTVRIEGHTNEVGAEDYNRELSQQRAEAVKQLLISNGVSADRIQAVGLGFDKPLSSDRRAAVNRRVEIVQTN